MGFPAGVSRIVEPVRGLRAPALRLFCQEPGLPGLYSRHDHLHGDQFPDLVQQRRRWAMERPGDPSHLGVTGYPAAGKIGALYVHAAKPRAESAVPALRYPLRGLYKDLSYELARA